MTSVSEHDLAWVRDLIHSTAALVLEPGKGYLVESRLAPIARAEGCSISELIARLRLLPHGPLHDRVVQAMTTNETSWFRDRHPFDALRSTVIPALMERRRAERSLTIWSAACSTGQEPYSIAMVLLDTFPELASWRISILASDLSEAAVARARTGRYTQLEVNRGMPSEMLSRHFEPDGADWRVNDRIRSIVRFGVVNLIGPWPQVPATDIVMLRNVMIYFDLDTKRRLLDRMHQTLRHDGYLFLGNAESTLNIDDRYVRVAPERAGCYQLRSHLAGGVSHIDRLVADRSRTPEGIPT